MPVTRGPGGFKLFGPGPGYRKPTRSPVAKLGLGNLDRGESVVAREKVRK